MSGNYFQNKIFCGEVATVQNYGAFVKIPGENRKQGLVHKSQISNSHVNDATEVLEVNDKVWCKVITVSDDGKIGLSMKVVDQGNGSDLDPNNVQMSLDAQQRKHRVNDGESKSITLEAIYNTTCSKCGVPGHLSKNCFQMPDSKNYSLIPEPEPEKKIFGSIEDRLKIIAGASMSDTTIQPDQQKKRKHSDSDSSELRSSKSKKKKKDKKLKKHKKSKKKHKESKREK